MKAKNYKWKARGPEDPYAVALQKDSITVGLLQEFCPTKHMHCPIQNKNFLKGFDLGQNVSENFCPTLKKLLTKDNMIQQGKIIGLNIEFRVL